MVWLLIKKIVFVIKQSAFLQIYENIVSLCYVNNSSIRNKLFILCLTFLLFSHGID